MKIKKTYALVLLSAFVLCACSTSKPEPVIPTYTVVLQAGEGGSFDNKTYLILNDVPEGTMLNQIDGYKLPTPEDPMLTFDIWLDDASQSVETSTPITSNMQLTATYANGVKYYADLLEEEKIKRKDYAINKQNEFGYYDTVIRIIDNALVVLNEPSKITPSAAREIYKITIFTLDALSQIDVVDSRKIMDIDVEYNIIEVNYNDCLEKYINYDIEKIKELSQIYITSHTNLYDRSEYNIYQEWVKKITNAKTPLDIYINSRFGAGLLRGINYLEDDKGYIYDNAILAIDSRLDIAKALVADENKLKTLIEALGYYATIFIKNDLENPFDPSILSQIYDKLFAYIQDDSTAFATQKIHMILALMKAEALSGIDLSATGNDLTFINYVEAQLTETNVEDITSIALAGMEALERCNKHGKNFMEFFNTIKTAIGYYNEKPEFLDCILYAMETAGHLGDLVQDDVFTKEYETTQFSGRDYFDYARISDPLTAAYNLYKNNIDNIPIDNVSAFKIIIKGVIKASLYGSVDPSHFINRFCDTTAKGLEFFNTLPQPGVNGYAYASAGFACMFANVYGTAGGDHESRLYEHFDANECFNIFNNWQNFFANCRFKYVADFIGKAIGLSWQNTFTWVAQPHFATGNEAAAYDEGEEAATNWQNRTTNMIPFLSEYNLDIAKSVISLTLKSSRICHYYINSHEDLQQHWNHYIVSNRELNTDNKIFDELFNLIFTSISNAQFIKRCEIYIDNFVNKIDEQNNDQNYKNNLDELHQTTKELMQEV